MAKPAVSVIIPCYNRAHCVNEAIDSVLSQSFQDFEIIVVDDGSTDSTIEVLKGYGDRLIVIRQENCGVSAARNTGIRSAQGEWIALLDSDDTWEPDKLKIQLEDLSSNPMAVAHMVDALIWDSRNTHTSEFELRGLRKEFEQQPFRLRPLCDVLKCLSTQCCMVRKEVVELAGYFDPTMKIYEDFDFLARIALEGPFVVNCYHGTNIRRITGGCSPLSDLYQRERLQSLQNLVHTYSRLKRDPRLTALEVQRVSRSLGGYRCEIAVQYLKQKQWSSTIASLYQSVADEPGLRSLARAFLAATNTKELVNRLTPSRRKRNSFRRSELDRFSVHKE
jgi:glycosyltransferase involved in cell wall biosynthesis